MGRPKIHGPNERKIHILIPNDLHKRVRIRCAIEDRSIQDYVASLIAQDMERFGLNEKVLKKHLKQKVRR